MVSFKDYVEDKARSMGFGEKKPEKHPSKTVPKKKEKTKVDKIRLAIQSRMDEFRRLSRKYQNKFFNYLDSRKSNEHIKDVAQTNAKLKDTIKKLEYSLTWDDEDGSHANITKKIIALNGLEAQWNDPNFRQKKWLKMMIVQAHEVGHAIQHHDKHEAFRMEKFVEGWYNFVMKPDFNKEGILSDRWRILLNRHFKFKLRIVDSGVVVWKELDAWEHGSKFIPESLMPFFMRSAERYVTTYLNVHRKCLFKLVRFAPEVEEIIRKFAPNYSL